ncbi:unnamed protein product [Prunus armeniaca]
MGVGYPCKVEGLGTVKIMMYDGVVCTISDVAYVPKVRKNLISLGRLDSLGCKCFVASGAMEITRGGLVLMKGRKYGGLYCLDVSVGMHILATNRWATHGKGIFLRVKFPIGLKTIGGQQVNFLSCMSMSLLAMKTLADFFKIDNLRPKLLTSKQAIVNLGEEYLPSK